MEFAFGKPFDRESLAVSSSVVPLTAAKYKTTSVVARIARVMVEAQPIRYTLDGTDPNNGATPPVGAVHAAGNDPIWLYGEGAIAAFKAIKSGGTDSVIHIDYWR